MRVSEGVPRGRFVELYNPEMFSEGEEVIVFTRDEFNRTYTSMQEQVDYINKIYLHLDESGEWMLIGYWPKILEWVHLLDLNMDLIFKSGPLQCYLDAYLYNKMHTSDKKVAVSERKLAVKLKLLNL